MKRFILLFCFILVILGSSTTNAYGSSLNNDRVTAVYFYSPTCSSCQELKNFFSDLKKKHKNLTIIEYSISNLENKSLMDKYSKAYNVSPEDEGTVPIVFIRNTYLNDEKDIKKSIDNIILDVNGSKTIKIEGGNESHDLDIKHFMNYKTYGILGAGIVNGINPCSMSMLLMFMSLLLFKKSIVLKMGISYSLGKFISYMLLGTVFFKFLESFRIAGFNTIIKMFMLVVIFMLLILNINDYFAASHEKYNKIRLQLPLFFRKFNHNMIRKVSTIKNINLLILISFALGIFISFGEFLCTGQIYLTTIVTVIQSGTTFGLKALTYLFIYNIGFILPTMALTLIVYKSKEIFDVSEAIRERLHIIKLINLIVLLIFGIITIYF
ncbi:MAG: cytochrome c biosis protein [Clostridiaceae bacterium]|jgi:thiol-disulfide isomerase/thioredoxin|nr:cytochrome c biosis protein [Clostridiaceae bacterium]